MDAWDVLRALKAGEIGVEDAKEQLTQPQESRPTPALAPPVAGHPGDHYGLVLSTVHHLDELGLREWVVPEPAADEVTIRVHASAVNFPDTMCVRGLYPTMPDYPFVPGFEVAGVIDRLGRRDSEFREGDAVIALTGQGLGGHASRVNVPLANVVHKPAHLSFEDACSLPVAFSTVYYAFEKAALAPREHVLIQTATGGCGLVALQLAHLKGCTCYGTSSREEKLAILKRLGVAHAMNYQTTEFDREIRQLTHGRGVDVVLNMLSGDGIQRGLNCLAPSGRYLELAVHALKASQKLDLSKLVQNQTIYSIDLRQAGVQAGTSARDLLAAMVVLLRDERLVPIVSRVYPAQRITEALAYVGEGRHIGKVVISHTAEGIVDRTEECIQGLMEQKRRAEAERARPLPVVAVPGHGRGYGTDPRLEGIAIIGMSGQFPMAPTVADFWENVARGRDCVSEIPPSRWSLDHFYDPDPKAPGKTYGKWMGVLEDIDKFDPLFFNISPAEAELMDPQQRLFLESCWHCIEDAGVSPASLSGRRCGVFVGCAPSDYGQFTGAGGMNAQGLLGGSTSILSARVSYLLNLKGPCLSIDTACSASLVAIAEACNSLALRDCDLALAGGVCVMPGPGAHIMTSKAGMLSKDGRCFTFDQRANGFVPGEGVGVVLLKRLAEAVRDGEPIYGVIRGWGVNQDGKTNGITAPSVTSQVSLETEVYRRFGIDPRGISLVEAHGTGTKLGDPIEVEALIESFRAFTQEQRFCALGSVKSNIGHLLAAAGVSGLIKVLMALQHNMLPPTINFETLNEHIDLDDSPFYINTELKPWPGPTRRAAVSTFGFSGTNAHLVIEGYSPGSEAASIPPESGHPGLFVLSARTEERLVTYASVMRDFIAGRPDLNLADVAYTLQGGRDAMDHRLAIRADSRQALLEGLAAFVVGRPAEGVLVGRVRKSKGGTVMLDGVTDPEAALRSWLEASASGDADTVTRQAEKLAGLWVQGLGVDWHRLYDALMASGGHLPRRVRLPGYPFARERCWIPDVGHLQAPRAGASSFLHPLMHRNTSTFSEQRFSSTFSGEEFFLADHVINGRRFLPAVAYLEMARAALVLAGGGLPTAEARQMMRLTDVVWVRPVTVGSDAVEIHVRLLPDETGPVTFEVYSEVNYQAVVHCQGMVMLVADHEMEPAPRLDLATVQTQCTRGRLSREQCYQALKSMNMAYGPGHRGIDSLYLGAEHGPVQVLARLTLPEYLRADLDRFILHPSLLDSALQAAIGFGSLAALRLPSEEANVQFPLTLGEERGEGNPALPTSNMRSPRSSPATRDDDVPASMPGPALPFAVERVDILGPCAPTMWALLREAGEAGGIRKLDVDLCDEAGDIRVRIRGYTSRILREGGKRRAEAGRTVTSATEVLVKRHPLIDADISDADERVFAKHFSLRDGILRDHVFDGVRVLPAAAIVEMAREAVARSGSRPRRITNFLMGYPLVGTERGIDTRLVLKPAGTHIDFTLISHGPQSGQHLLHSQGTVEVGAPGGDAEDGRLDLETIRARLPHRADLEHDYDGVVPHAVEFGPTLRTLREFSHGEREALARIVVGDEGREDGFVLHPLVIDGVFQAGAVAHYYRRRGFQPSVLFSIDRIEMLAPTGEACDVHITLLDTGHGDTMAFDATVCNTAGRIVARLTRVTLKVVAQPGLARARDSVPAGEVRAPYTSTPRGEAAAQSRPEGGADLFQRTEAYLKETIARVVKIPVDRIDVHEDFGTYGIDSLTIMHLNDRLGEDFHALPRTLFFEYITVHDLAAYFVAQHAERLAQLFLPPDLSKPAAYPLSPGKGHSEGGGAEDLMPAPTPQEGNGAREEPPALWVTPSRRLRRLARPATIGDSHGAGERPAAATRRHDIAIIGLAGRYPGAERLDQFWENLKLGRDCVTEIPAEAWDYRAIYDPERQRQHSISCKWGGFIKGADKFDPLFFHISPIEAETLDPQARIFLETAWHCVEDAGYAPRSFAGLFANRGVGVFVGVSTNEYQLLKLPSPDIDINGVAYLFSVANRVSYHLGFHGPSLSLDTACSSSLSAIHMACKSIIHGECEAAIAGGVNLSLHPHKYQYLSKGNFLASDGRCRSFGAGGDGYVPGEGAGAVLLKPLPRAVQDGDHIYGVIKGSAINHGGKTSGFTVPNPRAQAQLIRDTLDDAGVDARTINYVEAHGTGTELGDPIEIAGLAEAYAHATGDRQFCAIGSCKSNIGHLEAAAGIAQLTKVLLQMKHRQLVPSIHTRELNPNIDFERTPFYVQCQLSTWEPVVLDRHGTTHTYPRRAGISSFGVGGANAHLIVEAYEPLRRPHIFTPRQPWLLVLSAANEERLRVYAGEMADCLARVGEHDDDVREGEIRRDLVAMVQAILHVPEGEIDMEIALGDLGFDAITLATFVERLNERYGVQLSTTLFSEYPTIAALAGYLVQAQERSANTLSLPPRPNTLPMGEGETTASPIRDAFDLRDLAYTLQMGREPLEERLAVIVSHLDETVDVLNRFGAGEPAIASLYRGNARKDRAGISEGEAAGVADLLHKRALSEAARLWVAGLEIDWRPLYGDDQPARLSLPVYPFARERYWLPQTGEDVGQRQGVAAVQALHPLLQRNTSDFSEQRFSSCFSGREFFLADHRIQGQRILSGVAHLEMARAAVALAHGGLATGMRLRDVVWIRPFVAVEAQGAPLETDSTGPNQIHIGLSVADDGTVHYEIYGEPERPGDEPLLYSQGSAMVATQDGRVEVPALDLATLRQRCNLWTLDAETCYQAFAAAGLDYGPGHRGIETLYVGADCALARLHLPTAVAETGGSFALHPSLMDAALQASIGLMGVGQSGDAYRTGAVIGARPTLPFALDELEILAPCTRDMWAWVRYSAGSGPGESLLKLDIDLCDGQGERCVSFRGLSCRLPRETRPAVPALGTLMMAPVWRDSVLDEDPLAPTFSRHLAIFCELGELSHEELEACLAGTGVTCIVSNADTENVAARFQTHLTRVFEEVKSILRARPQGPVLVQVVVPGNTEEQRLFGAIAALLKTAHLENPNLIGQLIEIRDHVASWHNGLAAKLQDNRQRCRDSHVLYHDGRRLVAGWERLTTLPNETAREAFPLPWRDDGVYLISGGAGGLGLLFAEEIAHRTARATVVLAGRSTLAGEQRDRLAGIRARFPHATIDYRQADVAHEGSVTELVQWVRSRFGNLHGIVHAAGVLRDNFLLKKSPDELHAVLAPKVAGLVHLDHASRDCDLDYLVLCSSGSAAEGNAGQADYAAANAFMDAYAEYRNHLADTGRCRGRTLSVNWPLWQEGGMRVDPQTEDVLLRRMGLAPMATDTAFRALYRALASGRHRVWVLEGDLERLQTLFEQGAHAAAPAGDPEPMGIGIRLPLPEREGTHGRQPRQSGYVNPAPMAPEPVGEQGGVAGADPAPERTRDKAVAFFRRLLASAIKLPAERIEADVPLEHYGIDSILVVQMTKELEKVFGSLSKTLFFEYQNIEQLTDYFLKAHPDKLRELLGLQQQTPVARAGASTRQQPGASALGDASGDWRQRRRFSPIPAAGRGEVVALRADGPTDIAIIGLAGRYPMADDLGEFWANLQAGRDCITEVPPERWNHARYFDEDRHQPGKTYSKWGGFLNGVDRFDPLFFNISPREAEMMDPQERLFLECVYEAIEDAGYTRASLADGASPRHPGASAPVGVYVGVMYEEYQLYGVQQQTHGRPVALPGSPSSIANRVSYFCNFHGPSLAVDTMCSSSLTAIHLACESLKRGECQLAIAGGVNVSIHPNKYLVLGQGRFVSSNGRCASFGAGGDGYVPGEGVGAVLLKPLVHAIADGDHIYGVIKGSAINHGGKTNGFSVPNPHAQADAIGEAFRRAGIDPRTVSYLEAHGTGTSLGDPIEISALAKTFREYTDDNQFCAIGSVKSNIGHCESAAGIAGVTKVLLQLKHQQIVPSLHSAALNPNIDFANSPFTVSQSLVEWSQPMVATRADQGRGRQYPRLAGVSSFGAGGSNAHVVIEEYVHDTSVPGHRSGAPALVPLSAKNEDQLKQIVANLHRFLTREPQPDLDLAALAYTLQVGREAMEERLAFIVNSREELVEKLAAILEGRQPGNDVYRGTLGGLGRADKETVTLVAADEDLQTAMDAWIAKGKYEPLLNLWVKGLTFDWQRLYGADTPHGTPPRRLSLPTYPFDRQRYWAPDVEGGDVPPQTETLHPLLHRNTSDLVEQRFTTTLTGREFFLADHRVQGQAILPGAAYLEMACAAMDQAARALLGDEATSPTVRLEQAVWARPVVVTPGGVSLHISLFPEDRPRAKATDDVRVAYEIYSDGIGDGPRVVHGRGHAVLCPALPAPALDLARLHAVCDHGTLAAEQCYAAFAAMGLDYGPAHRAIDVLYLGADQVLARLCLPPSVADTGARFRLHPSLMDGALQAAIGLHLDHHHTGGDHPSRPALPFAAEGVTVFGPCTPVMWTHIRHAGGAAGEGAHQPTIHALDIDLCDEQGLVRVRVTGLTSRLVGAEVRGVAMPEGTLPVPAPTIPAPASSTSTAGGGELLAEKTVNYFKKLLASTLKLPAQQIRADAPMDQYGIDSVMVMELTGLLEQIFGPLSKTLFFEYQDIQSLSRYFAEAHAERLQTLLEGEAGAGRPAADAEATMLAAPVQPDASWPDRPARPRFAVSGALHQPIQGGTADIAIIGLAGRYPGARNVWEFWENLRAGKDCISEIPKDRWNHDLYFDADRYQPGKTYGKWGGFLDGVSEFDPRFFNIAPREAELMDPQERLFLQCVYEVLEDAGYTRDSLARYQNLGLPGNVGVYVGVMYEEYQLYGAQETLQGRPLVLSGSPSSIANRVSYFCNFHGPSLAVDTMCSSSLTAIHLACESLLRSGCELAVAGGVNVSVHPNKFIGLGQGQYLSSQGRCASFGAGGDGYVPGEGVGAVLLKPLARAIADGDHIYGVIKGSAINHGGKTNGFSVPNPHAQAHVIGQVFKQTGIDPRTISYLEAHGTGTSLGDPIEITGLTRAFREYTPDNQFCAIGSVKSNIGHCESAAGIAGITKILLQLQYRQLVPSLHADTLNPHIDFADSPFVVQRSLETWQRPQRDVDPQDRPGERRELPRVAGISSFGAGGSNAHVIIEEYIAHQEVLPDGAGSQPYLIVLSAKNAERLREVVANLHQALTQEARYTDNDLAAIAYTLQIGREAMAQRLAFMATSIAELAGKLSACLAAMNGADPHALDGVDDLFQGRVGSGPQEALTAFTADDELQEVIEKWLQRRKYKQLLRLWAEGLAFDWHRLYGEHAPYGRPPRRISLPTYPFARESYWVPASNGGVQTIAGELGKGAGALAIGTDHEDAPSALRSYLPPQMRAIAANEPHADSQEAWPAPIAREQLLEQAAVYLKDVLGSVLKISADLIEADVPMEDFGLDSIMVMQVTNHLEKTFGSLSKTLFFEYQNIWALGAYFATAHGDKLAALFGTPAPTMATSGEDSTVPEIPARVLDNHHQRPAAPYTGAVADGTERSQSRGRGSGPLDIAIIGLAGRYPGADTMADFWRNLRDGKDSISEIPKDRWDHSRYVDGDTKASAKWGGFLNGVDCFDPLFFNISPLEAELMDPQERLFLECVYAAIEDAGYTRASLAAGPAPAPVGVYVGVMNEEYQLYGAEEQAKGRLIALSGMSGAIANRVSYFCNFSGPSLAVNTMCSSSLTAIHLACQSLLLGECELAIAGGVSLSIHPNKYVGLARGKFLSSTGRCQAFGQGADGYVPGEGVGAVLLKPLANAIADGDHIYGIIRGSAVNHGAKSNGYTVPNPAGQAHVIGRALEQAGIDPRTISYLEAHGTGTFLGDPIEITALTRAIRTYTGDRHFCAIGSVKSNIGHCEGAAGIAGLTKVLLQLQHRQLAPSLHTEILNPHIDFTDSPFVVQRELAEWRRPRIEVAGDVRESPRIAGISSFGAGGSNAHLLIEEYIPEERQPLGVGRGMGSGRSSALIMLSAKDEERLKEQARQLLAFVTDESAGDLDLADVAYTLQVGREAMPHRLALIATSLDDLVPTLTSYLRGDRVDDLFLGRTAERAVGAVQQRHREAGDALAAVNEATVEGWLARGAFAELLASWVRGLVFDWHKLYGDGQPPPRRISLPTYPFARQRYWVPLREIPATIDASHRHGHPVDRGSDGLPLVPALHPLLHRNTSTLSAARFSTILTGRETCLTDHVIQGRPVLPAVAYLEMARAAASFAMGSGEERGAMPGVRLRHVIWAQPMVLDEGNAGHGRLHLGLSPANDGRLDYEISSESGMGAPVVHSRGSVVVGTLAQPHSLDLAAIRAQCSIAVLSREQCYQTFRAIGIAYGPAHQTIERVHVGLGQVLAKLILPASLTDSRLVLHPGLLDGALQATLGLSHGPAGSTSPGLTLPFALDELEVYGACTSTMWAFIRDTTDGNASSGMRKLDIDLCDEAGAVRLRMKGFSFRVLPPVHPVPEGKTRGEGAQIPGKASHSTALSAAEGKDRSSAFMLEPHWQPQSVHEDATAPAYTQRLSILCELGSEQSAFPNGTPENPTMAAATHTDAVRYLYLQADGEAIERRFQIHAIRVFEEVRHILAGKPRGKILLQLVVPNRGEGRLCIGLAGLLKTAALENPQLISQVIEVDEHTIDLPALLQANARCPTDRQIGYRAGKRLVASWREVETDLASGREHRLPWRDRGVYLITGGAGGLGLIFAEEIVQRTRDATVILAGRSAPDGRTRTLVEMLTAMGSPGTRVEYRRLDVGQGEAVARLVRDITDTYGGLHGIIHSAGLTRDSFILKKDPRQLTEVLTPKVAGCVNLDRACENLDFFVLFSSLTGAAGNPGQADYAVANAFMDAFAHYRNTLVRENRRRGRTLSINWPLWREGGMRVDPGVESMMEQHTGLVPMATATGLAAFYRGLALEADQVMVLEGDVVRLRHSLGLAPGADHQVIGAAPQNEGMGGDEALYRQLAEGIMSGEVSAEQMETLLLGLE